MKSIKPRSSLTLGSSVAYVLGNEDPKAKKAKKAGKKECCWSKDLHFKLNALKFLINLPSVIYIFFISIFSLIPSSKFIAHLLLILISLFRILDSPLIED